MNDKDYAIVVGISQYPVLGLDGSRRDLKAPAVDARLIEQWLLDPNGGNLPAANVACITSPSTEVTEVDPTPALEEVRKARNQLVALGSKSAKATGSRQFGRRLYIYFAGHGFSPEDLHAAVYTANANQDIPDHVWVSKEFNWLAEQGYFQEAVLWVDACAVRDRNTVAVPFAHSTTAGQIARKFVAFSAERDRDAVERPIADDEGRIHGIFTWTLYQGLKGAAADKETELVNGRSLRTYLEDNMKALLTADDRKLKKISDEPQVPQADAAIVFGQKVARLRIFPVTLSFPSTAVGRQARLWSNFMTEPIELSITAPSFEVQLQSGLYVAEVPQSRLRQGFEVSGIGPSEAHIFATGNPVDTTARGSDFILSLDLGMVPAEIFITGKPGQTEEHKNSVWERKPFGVYKVKAKVGRAEKEQIILLDRDYPSLSVPTPDVESAAPLAGTAYIHEYHMAEAEYLEQRQPDVSAGVGAQIFLMDRVWRESIQGDLPAEPVLQLFDSHETLLIDLWQSDRRGGGADPIVSFLLEVYPGTYYLRETFPNGRQVEQSLIVPEGWRLEAYILRGQDQDIRTPASRRMSLLLNRIHEQRNDENDRLIEMANLALANARPVLTDELWDLLAFKFENPLAGLVGAHLYLIEALSRRSAGGPEDFSKLNHIVGNLRGLLGTAHPDVEAISLMCPNESLRTTVSIDTVPMYAHSWRLLVDASLAPGGERLITAPLWSRVAATCDLGQYFGYWSDQASREIYQSQLRATLLGIQPRRQARPPAPQPISLRMANGPQRASGRSGGLHTMAGGYMDMDLRASDVDVAPTPARASTRRRQPGKKAIEYAKEVKIPAAALRALL